ncbi:hypothetical protein GCM10010168_60540 [Actinoplanes ianthinogenes]|uniref:Uncharacterized protein n=1 Tax=Actinoplanes ianthinogenes TaxID=122358 RepID=A0ABM7M433_9ACTN|nr:hypothetical protein [Actinoplanes ianthinogenes]BCJ46415.1 hypothetical protein Aiant_70720 [Actinoplanes ianthinogenes]GGR34085.1 hypothetical protein GCM10010168_60540 [Actinoplanes ianthinogenes]
MDDEPVAGPGARVAGQLVAVWLFGAIAPLVSGGFLLAAVWGGGPAAQVLAPVVLAADVGVLFLIARLTREATWLGATTGRLMLWAVLVAGLGAALWGLGWGVSDAAGLGLSRGDLGILLFGGLAFALIAGLLARPWPVPVAAAVLLTVLAAAGLLGLRASAPDDLTERLAHAGKQRDEFWAVQIPGYRPVGAVAYGPWAGGGEFEPVDPALIPPVRFYTVHTQPFEPAGHPWTCAGTAGYATRSGAFTTTVGTCAAEPGGLLHLTSDSGGSHGYLRRAGATLITVEGVDTVDRATLRAAVRAARPASAAELRVHPAAGDMPFVAPATGYRLQGFSERGATYEPADGISGIEDAMIGLQVRSVTAPSVCPLDYTCTTEPDGLIYQRARGWHAYVQQRSPHLVEVHGGLAVDRSRLRDAVLAARPATDAELRALLPEPAPRGPIDGLRRRLR